MSGNPRSTALEIGNNLNSLLKFATLFILLVAFSFSAAMAVEPEYDVQGIPVEPFVTPDGLFDIDSARAIGFEGALNLSGWSCFIDPETGEPILIQEGDTTNGSQQGKPGGIGTGFPEGAEKSPDDIFWSDEFGLPGFDGAVRAVAFYNGDLYVGGQFRYIDSTYIPYIAKWDGTSWTGVGSGMNSTVLCLEVYNGKLIAGGNFSDAGGGSYEYRIAAWDGVSWSSLGSGMNNYVWSLTVHNGDLYAGGYFTTAGGVSANRVAKWDGTSWSALGSGMNQWVYALTSHNGDLYAGGAFTTAGGVSANRVAKWDGSAWSALGTGMNGYVYALTSYGGNLVAGGNFWTAGGTTAYRIASWNGSSWSAMGSGMNTIVYALDIYDGNLVATGYFTYAGGTPANKVATWDGLNWSAVGSGTDNIPYAVAVSGTDLVVGGAFDFAGGNRTSKVARWDGLNWNSYPTTYTGKGFNNTVLALAVYNGDLIASGQFTTAGTTSVARIAAWDGTDWNPLGAGLNNWAWDMTVYNGSLIVGGGFTLAGGSPANRIAAWNGSSWSPLGSGLNSYVRALHVHGTDLIVGGQFTYAGGSPASKIAKWNGSSWSALGAGFNSYVFALKSYNGDLYAGGYFTQSGATSINRIARWDGSAWNPLGTGMNGAVWALEVYNNKLIAGGYFTAAGGTSAYGIAAWDGSSWSALGNGLYNPGVYALTVRNGNLIAGGSFYRTWSSPYTYLYRIAEWDGSSWNNIGSGVNSSVYALQVKDTSLWAGGTFTTAGGKKSHYIARWDKQGSPNDPPYAQCRTVGWLNVDSTCEIDTTNNNGSWDPDGDSITITYDPPGPYGPGQHLVTLIVTDEHGLADTCQSYIYIRDVTPPTITCPPDTAVQCMADVPAVDLSQVTALDNCDPNPTVSLYNSWYSGNCPKYLYRQFKAQDSSGYAVYCTQTITIDDTIPPVLTCPAPVTVQCAADVPNPNTSLVTVTDNCDTSPVIQFVSDSSDGGSNPETIYRKYRAYDDCGNIGYCTQIIIVNDTIPPVANCPADITTGAAAGQCSKLVAFTVSGTDNCGTPTVVASPPSGSTFPIGVNLVTVTATDASGNTNICTFSVTVNDTENPSITCPADLAVQCAADVPTANPGLVVTSDNCDVSPTVTWQGDVSDGLSCPETITRTYRATDDYGNWAECTQLIVINDTTAPTFDQACPASITVECDAIPNPPTLTASDNCALSPTVTFSQSASGATCTGSYTITRTWTATDDCGNQSQCVQVITVQDTQAPVFDQPCPTDIIVECDAVPAPPTLTATDNCDASPMVTYTEDVTPGVTIPCTGGYTITRTWTATDDCGNQSQCVQVITVQDTQAPVFDQPCPTSVTVECDAVPTPETLTATDNCDAAPAVIYQQDSAAGTCEHSYVLTRTWTATDNCGNQSQCVQVVTVQDTHAPSLYGVPGNITLECSDPVPPPANPTPTDNCDPNPVVTMQEDTTAGACPHSYTITRTWTATDACGNQFQRSQVITIEDATPPVFDQACPQAITVECSQVAPPPNMTATDNCDPAPVVVLNEVITPGNCTGNYTITRTWTATDVCGNVATCVQVVTVQDTEAPVFDQPCPVSVTVECDAVPQPPTLTTTDNCDTSPVVTFDESTTPGACADSYTLTRTWTATDDCGNSSQCVQVITVQDTQAPVFDQPCPANMTVDCDAIPDPATMTATDNCDASPQIVFESTITNGNCAYNYTITRNWYAADNCNNVAICTQVLTVQDTTSPVCSVPNDTAIFQCIPTEICLPVSSIDNCDPDPTMTLVGSPGQLVGSQWCYTALVDEVAVVTVRSTDSCGNICEATFTVDIDINEPPVVTCRADTAMFVCDLSPITLDGYSYTDPENNIATVEAVGGSTDGSSITFDPVEGTNVLTFIVTDSCGEVDSCSTTVEIDLNEPPVVTCPNDTTIHFNDILVKTATFTDGDSPPQTVSFSLGAGTPDGVTINPSTGQIVWPTNGGDVCGGTIEVIATDSCGEADTCSFNVCVQNTPPVVISDSLPTNICWGETATGGVDGSDADSGPSVMQYYVVSFDGPGSVMLDVNTGDWEWATQEDDSYVGDWELCVGVTDNANLCDPCSPENADTTCLIIHVDRVFEVKIEKTHQTLQGQIETVDITYESGTREMGGFNFLINYDAGVLQFTGAVPGPPLYDPAPDGCGWEYFTYRYGPNGNCGSSACPSGKLRVIGFAETNNGANHPNCFIAPSANLLLSLQFFVSIDRILECQYVPIRWCWYDCGDNTISSVLGDTLFISREIFEFEDTLGLNSIANPSATFPTFFGANSTCDVSGGDGKPEPSRCGIDFWNGGIDIVCADSIDARADLNLNGISYEVADAVLFSNYFIYGLSVFTVNVEGQVAASDVNGDGIVLSVADLVTLVRVVVGDELQAPKTTNPISADYVHRSDGVVALRDADFQIGAVLVVVEGDATPPELLVPQMQIAYAFDGERTRMLIWSPEGHSFSGSFLQVDGRIVRIEMADAEGTPVAAKMIPAAFALHQNFPNPFNPTTTLSFDLPSASGWELTVYNVSGRRVASWSGYDEVGTVQIKWEAGNVASGIYFYKLTAGAFSDTKKMVLLK